MLKGSALSIATLIGAAVLCAGSAAARRQSPQATAPSQQAPQTAPAGGAQTPAPPLSPKPSQPPAAGAPATPAPPAPVQTAPPVKPAEARRMAWLTLKDGLAEKYSERRIEAVYALGTMGPRYGAVPLVEKALDDKDSYVRQAAVVTLGVMKSRASIPKLKEALDDPSGAVSFSAAQVLWTMGDRSGADIFLQVLAGDRKTSEKLVKTQVHNMEKRLHDPTGLAEFGAEQAAGAFLGPGGFGIAIVADLARDKTAVARALSAKLLAQAPDPDTHDALGDALLDKNWVVKAAAAEALGQTGTRKDIEQLLPLLDNNRSAVKYKAAAAIVRLASAREPVAKPS